MEPDHLIARAALRLIGRAILLLLSSLFAAPAQAQAPAGCAAHSLAIGAALLRSDWDEFDALGRRLLRERGTLRETALAAAGECGGWALRARLAMASGSRAYEGVSTVGAPISTTSRLRIDTFGVEVTCCLSTGWRAGARLGRRLTSRDIASAGPVLGYPERFKTTLAEIGVRWQGPEAAGHELGLQAWAGTGPRGRVSIDLPQADPTTLELGRPRSLAIGAEVGTAPQSMRSFGWKAWLGWAMLETAAGPASALTRNGLVIGGAAQPRMRSSELQLGLSMLFDIR